MDNLLTEGAALLEEYRLAALARGYLYTAADGISHGNMSLNTGQGIILITPTGRSAARALAPSEYARLKFLEGGRVAALPEYPAPSSEWTAHAALHARFPHRGFSVFHFHIAELWAGNALGLPDTPAELGNTEDLTAYFERAALAPQGGVRMAFHEEGFFFWASNPELVASGILSLKV